MATKKTTTGRKSPTPSKKTVSKKKVAKKKVRIKKPLDDAGTGEKNVVTAGTTDQPVTDQAVTQTVSTQPTPEINVGTGGNVISWAALLLSALALCAGGYAWYLSAVDSRLNVGQQKNRFQAIEQRIGSFDTVQSDTNAQVSQLKNQIALAEDKFSSQIRTIRTEMVEQESAVHQQISNSREIANTQTEDFRKEFSTLTDSIVKLRGELDRSIDSWTLEEAEQLMFIANQRLQFAGESDLARRAMKLADERLAQLADPALNEIRQLIASEILALENIDVVDITGVLNKLTALSSSIEILPLAGDIKIPGKSSVDSSAAEESGGGSESEISDDGFSSYTQPVVDAAASFLNNLGDLVQVEKNGKSIRPVISAEARQITYDKVRLILESAQIALIRSQTELYQNRIASARMWVEENFDQSDSNTINWLASLGEVASESVQSSTPDISASLAAIRNLINNGG